MTTDPHEASTAATARPRFRATPAEFIASAFYVLGLGAWAAMLLVAGAIVAPVVFRNVPAPTSGDAMALVFARIDRASLVIALVLVGCEGILGAVRRGLVRLDLLRALLLALMVGGALTNVFYFTPQIADLHRQGVTRGVGEGGRKMDELHEGAKKIGSSICILAIVCACLQAARLGRRESS